LKTWIPKKKRHYGNEIYIFLKYVAQTYGNKFYSMKWLVLKLKTNVWCCWKIESINDNTAQPEVLNGGVEILFQWLIILVKIDRENKKSHGFHEGLIEMYFRKITIILTIIKKLRKT
jgi:hypothetical protein